MYIFSSQDPYFLFSTTQSDTLLKTRIKSSLKRLKIPHTKTHLWCGQISTRKKPGLLSLLFVERTTECLSHKPGPLSLTGRGRAGNDVTVTAADLQTLIRSPSLGKLNRGETDNPFVFCFLLSSCPIKTRVITTESYSDIRH